MSAQGMIATVIWTEIYEAMRKDGLVGLLPERSGPAMTKVINEIAATVCGAGPMALSSFAASCPLCKEAHDTICCNKCGSEFPIFPKATT